MTKQNQYIIALVCAFILFFTFVKFFPFKKIGFGMGEQMQTVVKKSDLVVVPNQNNFGVGFTGLEFGHAGRVWVNDLSGISGVYTGTGEVVKTKNEKGEMVPLMVKIDGHPTGQIFSSRHSFLNDAFVFVTLEGKIFGWHKNKQGLEPLSATLHIDNSSTSASYTGLTSKEGEEDGYLFAADHANNKIDVYDFNYEKVDLGPDAFVDKNLPENLTVFNVKVINDAVYVTYSNKNPKENEQNGGAINIFTYEGKLIKRLITGDKLNQPWGLAKTPDSYGEIGGNLLVGNFGDGKINIFDSKNGRYLGTLKDYDTNKDLVIDGLYALTYGTGNGAGRIGELFFAGKNSFGKLTAVVDDRSTKDTEEVVVDVDQTQKEFLTQEELRVNYNDFLKNITKDCIDNCVMSRLTTKLNETEKLYEKIFNDVDVIKEEFKQQKVSAGKVENLDKFVKTLATQDFETWLVYNQNECKIYALNYYGGKTLDDAAQMCMLYRTENWLKELYVLRSIYIRVELGPLGEVAKNGTVMTEDFKKLIKEEEEGVERSY